MEFASSIEEAIQQQARVVAEFEESAIVAVSTIRTYCWFRGKCNRYDAGNVSIDFSVSLNWHCSK